MRETKWNLNLAHRLWCAGVEKEKIAARVGISVSALRKAAGRNRWPKRRNYNGRIDVQPIELTKRCDRCLAKYKTPAVHDCGRAPQSIYGVAA